MPIIIVYGIPEKTIKVSRCAVMCNALTKAVVEELPGTRGDVPGDIEVFFPKDVLGNVGDAIIIFIESLSEKPKITKKVRKQLAQKLAEVAKKHFPDALIQCFVRPFDPEAGFWSTAKKK